MTRTVRTLGTSAAVQIVEDAPAPVLAPAPPAIQRLTREQYDGIDRLSCSQLKPMRTSPLAFRHALTHPREDTPDLRLGRCLDLRVLTPDAYASRVMVAPDVDRRTKVGKAEWAAFVGASAGREVIEAAEAEQVEAMAAALARNTKMAPYLVGEPQVAVLWECDGVPLKSLLDLVTSNGAIVDLKSARSLARFGAQAFDLGYHLQASMYVDAWKFATGEDRPFCLATIEKTAPYESVLFVVPDAVLDAGRAEYRRLLALYRACREADAWPGVEPVQFLELPRWSGVARES